MTRPPTRVDRATTPHRHDPAPFSVEEPVTASDTAVTLTLDDVEDLAESALRTHAVSAPAARSVAASVRAAEADGIRSHGLTRLPTYCAHAACGKIDGYAEPTVATPRAGAVRADAADGFAHPAIDVGLPALIEAARATGTATLAVHRSYNCGVVGYHVERLAAHGLLALGFANAPASMAPWGGRRPVVGTNPIACAIPREHDPPIVIDQSSSVVAKSELMVHRQAGEPIPEHWALDGNGEPTTDPAAALEGGTMAPAGGRKGATLALMVEALAAAATGATLGKDASSFADEAGGSPRTGQLFLAVDPQATSGGAFLDRVEALVAAWTAEEGARLPGEGRLAARERAASHGVTVPAGQHERLAALAGR